MNYTLVLMSRHGCDGFEERLSGQQELLFRLRAEGSRTTNHHWPKRSCYRNRVHGGSHVWNCFVFLCQETVEEKMCDGQSDDWPDHDKEHEVLNYVLLVEDTTFSSVQHRFWRLWSRQMLVFWLNLSVQLLASAESCRSEFVLAIDENVRKQTHLRS